MTQELAAGGVPKGTETEDWRVMSAAIAYAFWSSPERVQQRIEGDEPRESWAERAGEYRARIRYVLRQILAEKVEFAIGLKEDPAARMPQEWWDKTARLSWLLWLRKRRQKARAPEIIEQIEWEAEAVAYRTYVRNVVRGLRAQGIHLR